MTNGILVASDQKEEWLLPWWWSCYSRYNAFPVTFIDWGMSEEVKKWCRGKGTLISLSVDPRLEQPIPLAPDVQKAIELFDLFDSETIRPYWFSKPSAMLQTSYEKTLWIDLDCEILAPLDALFEYVDCPAGVAIALDTELNETRNLELNVLGKGETLYNSGVIVYKKKAPLIQEWADLCLEKHADFLGDQNAFSHLVYAKKYQINVLPETYNWRVSRGLHFSARIIHWAGSSGKAFIKHYGGLHSYF